MTFSEPIDEDKEALIHDKLFLIRIDDELAEQWDKLRRLRKSLKEKIRQLDKRINEFKDEIAKS